MNNNSKYTEDKVLSDFRRKHDLNIHGHAIQQLSGPHAKGDVGIKTKGKIDFLTNYCGYAHYYVDSFKF